MTETVLKLSDVAYQWKGSGGFSIEVPRLEANKGETILLLGRSGSGKSTLLSLICGIVLPSSGSIEIAETELTALSRGARDRLRAEYIGVIFQQFNLLPFGSVMDNILLPLRFAPERRKRAGNIANEALRFCSALGLPDGIEHLSAEKLSVGQQQRVAVARALIGYPPLIVADEPTSALDVDSQAGFLDLLFQQIKEHGTSLLMVSHDPRLGEFFDRVINMEDIAKVGRVPA
ncbi:ABC transporter ATP-binding protein [Aestuariibius insulae]|uniref:ABC transporter ATP-binding protein n=1 Tax=Aestuariibius insulae TaxID=2058287 RepID=UPI00345E9D7F